MSRSSPQNPRRRRFRRTALTLLITLFLTVGVAGVGAARASSAPEGSGWIRAGHLAPGAPEADVRLTPFAGGEEQTLPGVEYGELSDYLRVPAGLYTISLTEPGGARPMVSESVRVTADAAITVVATGEAEVRTRVVYDDLRPPPAGQARVRLLAGTTPGAPVRARVVDGPRLAEGVAPGTATGYAEVDAQEWSVALERGEEEVVTAVPVRAGGIYTLVALEGANGALRLEAVNDSTGTSTAPTGGVDTGGGGLAAHSPASSSGEGHPARPLGAAVLVILGALGVYARRRLRST